MPYQVTRTDIENIVSVLPDAVMDDTGDIVIIQDRENCQPVMVAVNLERVEEERKAKRQQLLQEVREVQSFKANVKKRVLCAIVNNAINSIHS